MKSSDPEKLLSLREGMIFGAIWSFASLGWIAAIALIFIWVNDGWAPALFGFGLVFLLGAVAFALALVASLVCEVLNVTTRKSRRDAMRYFSWAFLYNILIGGSSVWLALAFGEKA